MMSDPIERGHADSDEDLSTPADDEQIEPGAQPWVEVDDDAKLGSS